MRRVLAVVLLAGASSSAFAQPPPADALPRILRLQPDQAAAWRAYRDDEAMGHADALNAVQQAEQLNAMTTPQRLDALADQLRASEAVFQRHAQATRAFYAVLSPAQRGIFDQVTRLPVRAPQRPRPPAPPPMPSLALPPSPLNLPPPSPPGG